MYDNVKIEIFFGGNTPGPRFKGERWGERGEGEGKGGEEGGEGFVIPL